MCLFPEIFLVTSLTHCHGYVFELCRQSGCFFYHDPLPFRFMRNHLSQPSLYPTDRAQRHQENTKTRLLGSQAVNFLTQQSAEYSAQSAYVATMSDDTQEDAQLELVPSAANTDSADEDSMISQRTQLVELYSGQPPADIPPPSVPSHDNGSLPTGGSGEGEPTASDGSQEGESLSVGEAFGSFPADSQLVHQGDEVLSYSDDEDDEEDNREDDREDDREDEEDEEAFFSFSDGEDGYDSEGPLAYVPYPYDDPPPWNEDEHWSESEAGVPSTDSDDYRVPELGWFHDEGRLPRTEIQKAYTVKFPIGHVGQREDGISGYIPPQRRQERSWLDYRKGITVPPSVGMLENIEGARELWDMARRLGEADLLERIVSYYDHAMDANLQVADALLLAHKQIRHDTVWIRGVDRFFQAMEGADPESARGIQLILARAVLANSKLRDQIDMLRQGIDPDTMEFAVPKRREQHQNSPAETPKLEPSGASSEQDAAENAVTWSQITAEDRVKELEAAIEVYSSQWWTLQGADHELREQIAAVFRDTKTAPEDNSGDLVASLQDGNVPQDIVNLVRKKVTALRERATQAETRATELQKEKEDLQRDLDDENAHARMIEGIAEKYEKRIRNYQREAKRLKAKVGIPIDHQFQKFVKAVKDAAGAAGAPQKDKEGRTAVERAIEALISALQKIGDLSLPAGPSKFARLAMGGHIADAKRQADYIKTCVLGLLGEVAKSQTMDTMQAKEMVKYMAENRRLNDELIGRMHQNSDLKEEIRELERKLLVLTRFQKEADPWKSRIQELEKADAARKETMAKYEEILARIPVDAAVAFTDEQLQHLIEFLPTVSAYYEEQGHLDNAIARAQDIVASDNAMFNEMIAHLVKAFGEQALRQEMCNADMRRTRDRMDVLEMQAKRLKSDKNFLVLDHAKLDKEREQVKAMADAQKAEIEAADQEMRRQQDEAAQQVNQTARELAEQVEAVRKLKEETKAVAQEKKENYKEMVAQLEAKQKQAEEEIEKMKQKLARQAEANDRAAKRLEENRERLEHERETERREIDRWIERQKELIKKRDELLRCEQELAAITEAVKKDRIIARAKMTRLRLDLASMASRLASDIERKKLFAAKTTAKEVEEMREELEKEARHPQVCFCWLLKFFLPDVHKSIIACEVHPPKPRRRATQGRPLGLRPQMLSDLLARAETPSDSSVSSFFDDESGPEIGPKPGPFPDTSPAMSHGHGHGHSALASIWPYLCQLLTSSVWLVLLFLLQARNFYDLFWFSAIVIAGFPLYLFRVALYLVHTNYRRTRRSLPDFLRRILPLAGKYREPPEFWLLKTPEASAIVGIVVMTWFALTVLAAQAVDVERKIWIGKNDWRGAYLRDIGEVSPYPGWWPVEVDFRLAIEPVLGPAIELVHFLLFEMKKGSKWHKAFANRALEVVRGWM
ncbi:hypothetical protein B0T16DRAFT_23422 [Cercophora newfieldiana]|uniref:Uncharacterized protein n=1 Tax=Cercophora newfieldiana TaxID=92897 RepID=A0AA40CYB8_9PEZI|nr:hypothetical protein B0T16DRAFT_23422 [Cercophora newfieldiana]